jgi:hypothetical protein
MAFPSTGNGYQTTDGNVNEITLAIQGAPATVSAAGTLTAAQLLTGLIVASGTPGTQTLPTVALLEAALPNVKVDSGFNLNLINTAGSTATVATGTGWTIVGTATAATVTSAAFRARKTGDGTWTLYRIA